VRQLIIALRLYVDDSDCFPLFSSWTDTGWSLWPVALSPLLNVKVAEGNLHPGGPSPFTCPSVGKSSAKEFLNGITYGYVDRGFAFQGIGEKLAVTAGCLESVPVRESEVLNPCGTLAIGDGIARLKSGLLLHPGVSLERWRRYEPVPLSGSGTVSSSDLKGGDRRVRALHAGRLNAGYCDGHVVAEKLDLLFLETSDEALRRWNRDYEPHKEWLRD
jgi:prepilin-type processing-associated H-X9-DG protein